MNTILEAGPNLEMETWNRLRTRAIFEHCKWDPQCEDRSVLARCPLFLSREGSRELQRLAEQLTIEALAAEQELLHRPELWKELGIPRTVRAALRAGDAICETNRVRVMRFDFHFTKQGWRISEVNADVPGGYVEGTGWNSLVAEQFADASAPPSPSHSLVEAIRECVHGDGTVALVHATNFSDDRQVMAHLANGFRGAGLKPVLAGPRNVRWESGIAHLKDGVGMLEVDAAIRFFPVEWFPQLPGECQWANWFSGSSTILCNPGTAILLQSKRFPLVWNRLKTELAAWREVLPITARPEDIEHFDAADWVIKPAFGRVGEDVGMKNVTSDAEFRKIQQAAGRKPREWIAQRRFETLPVRTQNGNIYPCIGVFTVNRKFAGIYGRANRIPLINQEAQDVAVLIRDEPR